MLSAPVAAATITGEDRAIRAAPRPRFLLAHTPGAPGSWSVQAAGLDSPTWVPDCVDVQIVPGANGVRQYREGMPLAEQVGFAVQTIQQSGRVVLPLDLGYMTADPCTHPTTGAAGLRHRRAWESIVPPMRPGESVTSKIDFAAQNRAMLRYFADGKIPAPPVGWIDRAIRRLLEALAEAVAKTDITDEVRRRQVASAATRARAAIRARRPWDPSYTPDAGLLAEVADLADSIAPEVQPAPAPTKRARGEA